MRKPALLLAFLCGCLLSRESEACSVLYYIDSSSGKIYVVNNEDYWYDAEAYIQINPASRNKLARLWYGWDDFAQGGINEAGLFFDGAVTPEQDIPGGNRGPKGNLGDDILARCHTVNEALQFLEERDIALSNAHMMLGDASGHAVVVEWMEGRRNIVPLANNRLIMTNFLLSDPGLGNHPCPRYESINKGLDQMEAGDQPIDMRSLGKPMAAAVQVPRVMEENRVGGTLYTTFINISDMEFMLVYKLDNNKITRLDLKEEFGNGKKTRIKLK